MRKKSLLFMMFAALLFTSVSAADYCNNAGSRKSTHNVPYSEGQRFLRSLKFSDGTNPDVTVSSIQSGQGQAIYVDKLSTVFTTMPGMTVTPTADWNGAWMHGYLYVDFNNDGVFTPNLNDNGTPKDDSELIAFSHLNWKGKDVDHTGAEAGGGVTSRTLKPFKIPESVASGTYRARFNVDWDSYDPCGSEGIVGNGGVICDFTITIFRESFTVTVASADDTMGDVYIDTKGNKSKEVDPDGTETVTLTAEPIEGYHFVSWNLNGAEVSADAVYTTTLVTENRNYTADFAFTPVEPRQVTVLSSDNNKGSVAIISPVTEGNSITTGEIVTVEATPAGADYFFTGWSDGSEVVSTSTVYKYAKAPAVTLTANFITKYMVTINEAAGGTLTVKDGSVVISSGDRVAEGTVITINVKTNDDKGLDMLLINGVDVCVEGQDVYTTTVTSGVTIVPVYGAPKHRLYYSYEGAGYIEVWSADTYQEEGPFPVDPDGEQYEMEDILPFGGNVYLFVYPYNGSTLQSLLVDGEEKFDNPDLIEYGDLEINVAKPIHIKAVFSGVSTGVEDNVSATTGVKVYGVSGGIVIDSESAVTAEIFTAGGELIATPSVSGNSTVSIASGFYIVRVNGAAYKVSVK